MGIGREHLTNVLRNAQQSDAVLAELKKIVEGQGYSQFMNEASKIALMAGNIRLKESNDENSTCGYMIDGFKAALYQQCLGINISYAAVNPGVHQELVAKWAAIQQYITQRQGILNAPTGQGLNAGLSMGGGSGVSVSLTPSSQTAANGVAVSLGAVVPGALPGLSTPVAEAAAPAAVVASLLEQGSAKSSVVIAQPTPTPTPMPRPVRRTDVEYLTGDHMESFNEHNLMELEAVAMPPAQLNRSVAQYREKGNYTDNLVSNLINNGIHRYEDGNIIVTMEDRARNYHIFASELQFLRDAGDAHQQLVQRELKRARNSDEVEIAYDALLTAVKSCKMLIDNTVEEGKKLLAEQRVSVVEMTIVQTFIRKFCDLLDLRVARTIDIMTVKGMQIPTLEGRGIRWDGNMADLTFLMTQVYDKAAGENGVVEDSDSFRLIFIAVLQSLCTIDLDWSATGVTVHNVVTTIWLPTNYPLDKSDCVGNKTLGNVHEPVQSIHDELMKELPASSVVLAMPSASRVLCGAGDSTVIYY